MVSFDYYGTIVSDTYSGGLQWIKDNIKENMGQHKILIGWCLSLSQQFLLAYLYMSHRLHDRLSEIHITPPLYSKLLVKMGLDCSSWPLFDTCATYDAVHDLAGKWETKLADQPV